MAALCVVLLRARATFYVLPYVELAVLSIILWGGYALLSAVAPASMGRLTTLQQGLCILNMSLGFGLLMRRSVRLSNEFWDVYWFLTLVVALPLTATVAVLSHNGHWFAGGLWGFAVFVPLLATDQVTVTRVTAWGTAVGALLYTVADGGNTLLGALSGVPLGCCFLVGLYLAATTTFTRGRETMALAQVNVMRLRCAMMVHDSKGPLINAEDKGKALANHLPEMVRAHKEMSLIEPEEYTRKKKKTYDYLMTFPQDLMARAREGLEFIKQLLGELRDPLQDAPQVAFVSIRDCLSKAISYELTDEQYERVSWCEGLDTYVIGNLYLVAHAMGNLLRNALQHTRPGDAIQVWTDVLDDVFRVHIQDPGRGIASGQRFSVFDPFFTATVGGTGVGLPLVEQVIEALGGKVRLVSVAGQGTYFILEFPLYSREELEARLRKVQTKEQQRLARQRAAA
ncbi:MAG: ATP-binding protein [Myxococcota bacterium]